MSDMKSEMQGQVALPIPNPADWLTRKGAAQVLDVSERTIERMVSRGTLTEHRPYGADGERVPGLFWMAEVLRAKQAQLVLSKPGPRTDR